MFIIIIMIIAIIVICWMLIKDNKINNTKKIIKEETISKLEKEIIKYRNQNEILLKKNYELNNEIENSEILKMKVNDIIENEETISNLEKEIIKYRNQNEILLKKNYELNNEIENSEILKMKVNDIIEKKEIISKLEKEIDSLMKKNNELIDIIKFNNKHYHKKGKNNIDNPEKNANKNIKRNLKNKNDLIYSGNNEYLKNLLGIFEKKSKNNIFFISGSAGSGKSTLIKELSSCFRENNINFSVTSSTGISSSQFENARTIHSFLGIKKHLTIDDFKKIKNGNNWNEIKNRVLNLDYLIIDEISMIRNTQFDLIELILKNAKENDFAFGGVKILLFGDLYQLPPVTKREENLPNTPWIFKSNFFKNDNISFIFLNKVYRQSDDEFLKILLNVRESKDKHNTFTWLKKYEKTNFKNKIEPMKLFPKKNDANAFNIERLKLLDSKEHIFEGEYISISKKDRENHKEIIAELSVEEKLILKKGAKIIHLVNDNDKGVFNGSTGIIKKIEIDKIQILFDDGKNIWIEKYEWKNYDENDSEKILSTFIQFPIKLAFAITIHKSQGMTLDYLDVDCKEIFTDGQLYVALSRIKDVKNLKLSNLNKNHIKTNSEVEKFYNNTEWIKIPNN